MGMQLGTHVSRQSKVLGTLSLRAGTYPTFVTAGTDKGGVVCSGVSICEASSQLSNRVRLEPAL